MGDDRESQMSEGGLEDRHAVNFMCQDFFEAGGVKKLLRELDDEIEEMENNESAEADVARLKAEKAKVAAEKEQEIARLAKLKAQNEQEVIRLRNENKELRRASSQTSLAMEKELAKLKAENQELRRAG